jgi:hypothetical protein
MFRPNAVNLTEIKLFKPPPRQIPDRGPGLASGPEAHEKTGFLLSRLCHNSKKIYLLPVIPDQARNDKNTNRRRLDSCDTTSFAGMTRGLAHQVCGLEIAALVSIIVSC